MLTRRTHAWMALTLAVLLFLGVNIFAANMFTATRLDLTENGTFTISDGTRKIIAGLPEPVTLKFYYSRKAAATYAVTAAYAKRVRDLLAHYASLSNGKIILEDIDPEAFTPEEDQAAADGLTPAPTESGEVVYFGLAGSNSIGGKEVLTYFAPDREAYLEYDLSTLVYRLSHPQKPKLALASSLMQGERPPAILAALRQAYDVTPLQAGFAEIPAGTDLLVLAHATDLGVAQFAAIDGFAKRGGRVLALVDPMSEMAEAAGGKRQSDLGPLLQSWGIAYASDLVVLDRPLAQRVATGSDPRVPSLAYPLWLHLTADNFDRRDPITANLQNMNIASAGALRPAPGAAAKFQPLLFSSDQAVLASVERAAAAGGPDGMMALSALPPGKSGQRFTLAARVIGLPVVVIADSDLLDDRFWIRGANAMGAVPFADNGGLVMNAVENLTGAGELIALRTRTNTDRPFTVVRQMQAEAEARFRETAQALQARLTAAQQQVQLLSQGGRAGTAITLTAQQQADVSRLRQQMADTRSQLRDVQRNLRADIDALGGFLAFLNIVFVPLLVAGFAIVAAMLRRARARSRTVRAV